MLSSEDISIFHKDKVLVKKKCISNDDLKKLLAWSNEIQDLPETKGKWLQYFQDKGEHRLLSRTENILSFFPDLHSLLREKVIEPAKELIDDDLLVFKDKLIYKLPGSQGFAPHQDMAGYVTFKQHPHIICLIAIDDADETNGCLQVIRGYKEEASINNVQPELDPNELNKWERNGKWENIKLEAGDVVYFGMYVPHRSAPNKDAVRSRRAFYLTLNKASEGDFRNEYFRLKSLHDPPERYHTTEFEAKRNQESLVDKVIIV